MNRCRKLFFHTMFDRFLDPTHKKAASLLAEAKDRLVKKHYNKGIALYQGGELHLAVDQFNEVLKIDPAHRKAQEYLMKARIQLEIPGTKPIDGIEVTQSRVKETAEHYNRGLIEYANGHLTKAIEAWEFVLRLDPDHEKAKKNLEKAKEELRKMRE